MFFYTIHKLHKVLGSHIEKSVHDSAWKKNTSFSFIQSDQEQEGNTQISQ